MSKYSRYICGGRNERLSIMLIFIPQELGTSFITLKHGNCGTRGLERNTRSRTEQEVSNGTRGLAGNTMSRREQEVLKGSGGPEWNTRSQTNHEVWNVLYIFHIQKCLETGKLQNPLKSHYFKGFCLFNLDVDN